MGQSDGMLVSNDYINGTVWTEGCKRFVTAKSHAALVIGDVVVVSFSATGPLTAAAATSSVYQQVGVVCEAAAAADAWVKIQIAGPAEASVEGTTDVAAGDFLEVLNTENDFKKDGAARTVYSVAVAIDAQASATPTVVSVWLLGDRNLIAAS